MYAPLTVEQVLSYVHTATHEAKAPSSNVPLMASGPYGGSDSTLSRFETKSSLGKSIERYLTQNQVSQTERALLVRATRHQVIVADSGNVTIDFLPTEPLRDEFIRKDFPLMMRNSSIQTINGLSRSKLEELHNNAPIEQKSALLVRLAACVRDRTFVPLREDHAHLFSPNRTDVERVTKTLLMNTAQNLQSDLQKSITAVYESTYAHAVARAVGSQNEQQLNREVATRVLDVDQVMRRIGEERVRLERTNLTDRVTKALQKEGYSLRTTNTTKLGADVQRTVDEVFRSIVTLQPIAQKEVPRVGKLKG